MALSNRRKLMQHVHTNLKRQAADPFFYLEKTGADKPEVTLAIEPFIYQIDYTTKVGNSCR